MDYLGFCIAPVYCIHFANMANARPGVPVYRTPTVSLLWLQIPHDKVQSIKVSLPNATESLVFHPLSNEMRPGKCAGADPVLHSYVHC